MNFECLEKKYHLSSFLLLINSQPLISLLIGKRTLVFSAKPFLTLHRAEYFSFDPYDIFFGSPITSKGIEIDCKKCQCYSYVVDQAECFKWIPQDYSVQN